MQKKVITAILITVGLLIAAIAVSFVLKINAIMWMLVVTAILAAIDSKKLEFTKYRSAMSQHPVVVFLLVLCFWPVAMSWHLYLRQCIKDGTAPLKADDTALNAGR